MDDFISRQDAIDATQGIGRLATLPDNDPVIRMSAVEYVLFNLPSAQPEQRWIPCSERLPEKGGQYLVTRGHKSCGNLWNRAYIVNYSDLMGLKKEKIWWSGNVGKSDFERHDDVLAWMPLPEAWKGEHDG